MYAQKQSDSPAKTMMMDTTTAKSVSILLPQSARHEEPTGAHLASGHCAGGKSPPRQYQLSGHCSSERRSEQYQPLAAKQGVGGGGGVDMLTAEASGLYII